MKHRANNIVVRLTAGATCLLGYMAALQPALAEQPATTLQTLLDKQQIQDMLVDYYTNLGKGNSDFGSYYLPDGVINVNGLKGKGEAAIANVYKRIGAGTPKRGGVFRMLLTNVSIKIDGNAATADTLWTGINSPTISAAPEFVEQGTEQDELVKVNGHWLFKLRVITSNAGRQAMFDHMPIRP